MHSSTTLQTKSTECQPAVGAPWKGFTGSIGKLDPTLRAVLLAGQAGVAVRAGADVPKAQRYVLAWPVLGSKDLWYACDRRGATGFAWRRHGEPLEFSRADLVHLAPRLKVVASKLLAIPVERIRVGPLNKSHHKKAGVGVRVVKVGAEDLAYTPLSAVLRGENAPYRRCLHLVPFFGSK